MKRCPACSVDLLGEWARCPLCRGPLADASPGLAGSGSAGSGSAGADAAASDPYPTIPLRFDRRQLLRILTLVSLLAIAGSLLAQVVFPGRLEGLRLVWFGLISMWLVVLIVVRKRRNVAKGIAYLVVLGSLVLAYADFLSGWGAWSTTYAIPAVCTFAVIALLIAVRLVRLEPREYRVYSWLTLLFGLVPGLFIAFGWVTDLLPSLGSVLLSAAGLLLTLAFRGSEVRAELGKRLNV